MYKPWLVWLAVVLAVVLMGIGLAIEHVLPATTINQVVVGLGVLVTSLAMVVTRRRGPAIQAH